MTKLIDQALTKDLKRISAEEFENFLDVYFEIHSEHKEIIMEVFPSLMADIHESGSAYSFYTKPIKDFWNGHEDHKARIAHNDNLFIEDQRLRREGNQRMLTLLEVVLFFREFPEHRSMSGPFVYEDHVHFLLVGKNLQDDARPYYAHVVPKSRLDENEDTQILFAEITPMK